MPVPDGDVGFFAEVVEADKLIIDECLEGANIEGAHACGRVLPKLGQDGKEGCLGFAGSRGCRQEHIVLRVKDGICRRNLDRAQAIPFVGVEPTKINLSLFGRLDGEFGEVTVAVCGAGVACCGCRRQRVATNALQ